MPAESSVEGDQVIAAKLKCLCLLGDFTPLHDHLDALLSQDANDPKVLSQCKTLLAGGLPFEEFTKGVNTYDHTAMCNKSLGVHKVSYRCYTCGVNSSMSLCSNCFESADHTGHEIRMYLSAGHGSCDCGNTDALKEEGFCPKHGKGREINPSEELQDLMIMPREVIPRLLKKVVYSMREHFVKFSLRGKERHRNHEDYKCISMIKLLESLIVLGDTLLNITAEALMDEQLHKSTTEHAPDSKDGEIYQKFIEEKAYKAPFLEGMEEYKDRFECTTPPGEYTIMADEFIFFLAFEIFLRPLDNLVLLLFGNDDFKKTFARAYIRHYPQFVWRLEEEWSFSQPPQSLVLMGTQVMVFESTALDMVQNKDALYIFLLTMIHLGKRCLVKMETKDPNQPFYNMKSESITTLSQLYPMIGTDFHNALVHPSVAKIFMEDPELMRLFVQVVSVYQGLFTNKRRVRSQQTFDTEEYMYTISNEDRVAAKTVEFLLQHCTGQDSVPFVLRAIEEFSIMLNRWFEATGIYESDDELPANRLTFYLPLHRAMAAFLKVAVTQLGLSLDQVLPDGPFSRKLLKHVLRIQTGLAEFQAHRWDKTGPEFHGQAMLHQHTGYMSGGMDRDHCLLQLCAMQVDPDFFVLSVLRNFGLLPWLTTLNAELEGNRETYTLHMLEAALMFFLSVLGVRTTMEPDEKKQMRDDLSAVLSTEHLAFSDLQEKLPFRFELCGENKQICEELLEELADNKPIKENSIFALQDAVYIPKDEFWSNVFDPVHVRYRLRKQEYVQKAMDKYKDFVEAKRGQKVREVMWPPYRIREPVHDCYNKGFTFVNCKTMHAFLFAVLYKAVSQKPTINETALSYAIHLLTNCLQHSQQPRSTPEQENSLSRWFDSSEILENMCHVVHQVNVMPMFKEPETVATSDEEFFTEEEYNPTTWKTLKVEESLISLLVKLHSQLSGQRYDPDSAKVWSLSDPIEGGGGPQYISRVLDHLMSQSVQVPALIRQACNKLPADSSPLKEAAKKRRRAEKAREKQIAKMKSGQKKFEEQTEAMDVDSEESQDGEQSPMDTDSSQICILCKKSEHSSENPLALLAFLQASPVLGKRKHDNTGLAPSHEGEQDSLCATVFGEREKILMKNFSKASCELSVSTGWQCGLVVQTCGHFVHIGCLKPHQETKKAKMEAFSYHQMYLPQFDCPLCHINYFEVLPVLPLAPRETCRGDGTLLSLEDIKGLLWQQDSTPAGLSISVTSLMELFPLIYFADQDSSQGSVPDVEHKLMFFLSVARTNLEMELLKLPDSQEQSSLKPMRRTTLNILFRALRQYIRQIVPPGVFVSLLEEVAGSTQQAEGEPKVPMLLRDPVSLLLNLCLALPQAIQPEHFDFLTNLLFKTVCVTASLHLCVTLTKQEQENVIRSGDEHFGSIFTRAIQWMVSSNIHLLPDNMKVTRSTKDLYQSMRDLCLPYLRIASLLKQCTFDVDLNTEQGGSSQEFDHLCQVLNLQLPEGNVPESWYLQLSAFVEQQPADAKTLLCTHPRWCQPDWIPLPEDYFSIYRKYHSALCDSCTPKRQHPALCLSCGTLVYCYSQCCSQIKAQSGEEHSKKCGYGSSAYLLINECVIYFMHGPRSLTWGSVYLDSHGEEDKKFERGRALFLNQERLMLAKQVWISNMMDQVKCIRKYGTEKRRFLFFSLF